MLILYVQAWTQMLNYTKMYVMIFETVKQSIF